MELNLIGVTPAKEKQFEKKGIKSIEELLRFVPRKYNDFSILTGILPSSERSCLIVIPESLRISNSRIPVLTVQCRLEATGERIRLNWFHQNFRAKSFHGHIGQRCVVSGKVTYDPKYGYSIPSPEVFEIIQNDMKLVQPVYSKIAGMSDEYLREKIALAFSAFTESMDIFPPEIVKMYSQLSLKQALQILHMPNNMAEVEMAQQRLVYDELIYFALCNSWQRRNSAIGSPFMVKTLKLYNEMLKSLPFELTDGQKEAVEGMLQTAKEGRRIHSLVSADVGAGKSQVSFLLMAAFAGSGYQTVLMAPTQVLARQHYKDLSEQLAPFGEEVVYLGTDMKASEKKKIAARIEKGEVRVIVGTQSVISRNIKYHNLALTVTDEEHKFGVAQRNALMEKASCGVHSISMSATPIPRSLAQVMYGESIQMHTIKTMPKGRKPVITGIATTKEKLFNFIRKEAAAGHQTYVVCPMIESNEDLEGVASVEEVKEEYEQILNPYGVKIATLSGKDSKEKTEEIITKFKANEYNVLISTTVVEVGVNVPTATMMVIVNAERFGLASLHQLRGRVGRGSLQSYCVLDASHADQKAMDRLNVLVRSNDGFEIAKADLAQRGAGDFIGTRQSGENKYLSLMLAYPEEYKTAQHIADILIDEYGLTPEQLGGIDEA